MAPDNMMSPAEREAIEKSAHIALDSVKAKRVRAFLEERFGADMVTDDIVRVTVAGLIEEEG